MSTIASENFCRELARLGKCTCRGLAIHATGASEPRELGLVGSELCLGELAARSVNSYPSYIMIAAGIAMLVKDVAALAGKIADEAKQKKATPSLLSPRPTPSPAWH